MEDADKLDNEVNGLMDELSNAEEQLSRKKAEADQDMMMAAMVRTQLCHNMSHHMI